MANLTALILVVILGLVPRLWRITADLQIHFDQGLHALETWNIWHEGKFTLLGHMTDTAGVFHGPIYYWLMTPAYAMGGGDPAAAAIFQILLQVAGIFFLADLARRMFSLRVAIVACLLYATSYGYISYARWLSNVTPTFLLSLIFFWAAWRVYQNETKFLPLAALFASLTTQMNGAIGIFLYPILAWLVVVKRVGGKELGVAALAAALPHLPQLVFELRHDMVVTRAVLGFSAASGRGLGWPAAVLVGNLQVLYSELVKLISWPWPVITSFLLLAAGVDSWRRRRLAAIKFLWISSAIFVVGLSLWQRGAVLFFFVPLFALATILLAGTLVRLRSVGVGVLILVLGLNGYHWRNFLIPTFALTPIGTFNLITNADRKNAIDWIYQRASGRPFAVWIYTIPYYWDQPWVYYFAWYGKSKYGYLPEKTGGFSPGDLRQAEVFFAIYEPDDNQPQRLAQWLDEVGKNFGPTAASFTSNDARVEQRSKIPR